IIATTWSTEEMGDGYCSALKQSLVARLGGDDKGGSSALEEDKVKGDYRIRCKQQQRKQRWKSRREMARLEQKALAASASLWPLRVAAAEVGRQRCSLRLLGGDRAAATGPDTSDHAIGTSVGDPSRGLKRTSIDRCGELQGEGIDGADEGQTLPSGGDVVVAGKVERAEGALEGDCAVD
ncbi:hypothetical protein BHE74_00051997, partial [Ensete ventricosum]